MAKIAHLAVVPAMAPTRENGTVPPLPVRNRDRRGREYLTPAETELLIVAAGKIARVSAPSLARTMGRFVEKIPMGRCWNEGDRVGAHHDEDPISVKSEPNEEACARAA